MSWFDELFGNDNNSNEELLRRKNKRRQDSKTQMNDDNALLPENDDIYDRPKGKFRFPIDVGRDTDEAEDAIYQENSNENEEAYHNDVSYNNEDLYDYGSYHYDDFNQASEQTQAYDSAQDTRRRRRRNHTNHDDTGIPSIKERPSHRRENASTQSSSNQVNSQRSKYSTSHRNSNDHERVKLQSERFKSSYNTRPQSTYHKSSFKTSEVPSAIFGTKKRRPIRNGVIPPAEDSEDNKADSTKDYAKTAERVSHNEEKSEETFSKNNNMSASKVEEKHTSVNEASDNEMSNAESKQASSSYEKTPNYSQKDNTINIENIYASQIVEEIRKERERKAQQKRKFKEALQNKRQQTNNEDDDIQKAIDEMYAQQAKQYTGESSLDDSSFGEATDHSSLANENDKDSASEAASHEISRESQSSKEDPEDNEQQQVEELTESSPYNYEEIDLNQVPSVQQVKDEDVKVENAQEDKKQLEPEEASVQQADDSTQLISDKEPTFVDNESDEHIDSASNEDDNGHDNIEDYEENNTDESDGTTVDEANYRELDNAHDDSHEAQEEDNLAEKSTDTSISQDGSSISENHSPSTQTQNETNDFVQHAVESETEYATKPHQHTDIKENEVNDLSGEDNNSDDNSQVTAQDLEDNNTSDVDDTKANETTINEHQNSDKNQVEQPKKSLKDSIKPGSKPFNVVMTPSDKKRMMDAFKKKSHKVSVPELKPETKANKEENNASSTATNNEGKVEKSVSNNNQIADQQADNQLNSENHVESDHSETSSSSHQEVASNHSVDNTTEEVFSTESPANQESTVQKESNAVTSNKTTSNEVSGTTEEGNQANSTETEASKPAIRKGPNIKLPSLDLLENPETHEIDEAWIEEKKQELNDAFYYFNVPAEVQNVTEGPSVTRFELAVEKGVKVSRITALQDDIKMALAAKDIRIEAPIPGTSLVGIEVPNQNPTKVNLKSILETEEFKNAESKLTVAMGNRINNDPLLMDIAKTPHALIAGATGSGKSVCINSILMSLLYKNHPEELRLLLIDPKMVELAPYNDLPHLVSPVITDVKAATQSLKWAVEEMERRYKLFAQYHVRNITAFNKKASYEQRMPKIVIVIDELADLMMMAPQEVEQSIARIAQKARACGIHMLVATQRPSVNVITGLIKANIPTRIAFMVSSSVDSRTILDSGGAERLLGYGDMLYLGSGMNKPIRVQGTFVSDDEIDEVVDFIKAQREPNYLFEEKELLKKNQTQAQDELFDDVCEFMVKEGHISTSLIQRHFQIGYNRAARIVDQLEQLNYISGANGSKPRDVYITEEDLKKD
ncbi:DNA translocase FtsK [Staphylococcus petrasii]|uniref:DNA translocase FtsK n=1 Tax=Staphylococcus petrasii TaxID=1276936 RepID=UPI003F66BEC9